MKWLMLLPLMLMACNGKDDGPEEAAEAPEAPAEPVDTTDDLAPAEPESND